MRLLVDLETGAWSTWANSQTSSISLRRRDRLVVAVRFGRGGQVVEWPENAAGTFAIKLEFGGQFVALAPSWTPSGYGADRHYSFDLSLNTQELESLFAEEPASVSLLAEVSVTSGTQIFSSQTLRVIVTNDVIRGDEGATTAAIELKATQAEAEAGTSNDKWMTPLRTKQAIDALAVNADWNAASGSSHNHPASAISDSTGSGRTLLTSSLTDARAHLNFFPSFADRASFPATGDLNRVYTALDTFKTYVWVTALNDYVEISPNIKSDWNATSGDSQILNKPTLGTAAAANTTDFAADDLVGSPVEYVIACSNETTALTVGAAKVTFRTPVAFRLASVSASVSVAPTGSTLVVDINNGANSVLSTKLSIDATEKTSATAATAAVINTSLHDFTQDAEITIDIDQIGSTVAGAGLKVILRGTRL